MSNEVGNNNWEKKGKLVQTLFDGKERLEFVILAKERYEQNGEKQIRTIKGYFLFYNSRFVVGEKNYLYLIDIFVNLLVTVSTADTLGGRIGFKYESLLSSLIIPLD